MLCCTLSRWKKTKTRNRPGPVIEQFSLTLMTTDSNSNANTKQALLRTGFEADFTDHDPPGVEVQPHSDPVTDFVLYGHGNHPSVLDDVIAEVGVVHGP